LREYNGTN